MKKSTILLLLIIAPFITHLIFLFFLRNNALFEVYMLLVIALSIIAAVSWIFFLRDYSRLTLLNGVGPIIFFAVAFFDILDHYSYYNRHTIGYFLAKFEYSWGVFTIILPIFYAIYFYRKQAKRLFFSDKKEIVEASKPKIFLQTIKQAALLSVCIFIFVILLLNSFYHFFLGTTVFPETTGIILIPILIISIFSWFIYLHRYHKNLNIKTAILSILLWTIILIGYGIIFTIATDMFEIKSIYNLCFQCTDNVLIYSYIISFGGSYFFLKKDKK